MPIAATSADAFLISYPKSGRTWLRFILANYFAQTSGLDAEISFQGMFRLLPNLALDSTRGIPAFDRAGAKDVPLLLSSHYAYQRSLFRGAPVVFMVRDPRDIMVSAFFHATRHKQSFDGDMTAYLDDAEHGLPKLAHYLNGWAANLPSHRHLVITYERLSAAPEATVAGLLRFLDLAVDTNAVAEAVRRSRFDVMRAKEKKEGIPAHDYDKGDDEACRMRRGKAGGYADYLTPAQLACIDERLAANLSVAARGLVGQTGYFPWAITLQGHSRNVSHCGSMGGTTTGAA